MQLGPNAHTHIHTHIHSCTFIVLELTQILTLTHTDTRIHKHTLTQTYTHILTNTHTHREQGEDTALCELGHIRVALSPSEGVAQSTGGSQVHPGSLGGTSRLPCPQTRTIRIFVPPTTFGLHPRASSPLPTFLPWHFPLNPTGVEGITTDIT